MGQDSLSVSPKEYYLHITVDYGKLAETVIGDQVKWEFGVGGLFFDHYNFTAEYGYGELLPKNVINNGSYKSIGNYFRGGFDYVFQVAPNRSLAVGLLFAYASFSDEGTIIIESDIWDDLNKTFQRQDLSAQWLELVINTEGPVFKSENGLLSNIYWGTKFRTRIMLTESETDEIDIFAVPGFGKRFRNVMPAVNLFLKFRFPID
jgi:hypothetical protein